MTEEQEWGISDDPQVLAASVDGGFVHAHLTLDGESAERRIYEAPDAVILRIQRKRSGFGCNFIIAMSPDEAIKVGHALYRCAQDVMGNPRWYEKSIHWYEESNDEAEMANE